jgi:hypothetical protein
MKSPQPRFLAWRGLVVENPTEFTIVCFVSRNDVNEGTPQITLWIYTAKKASNSFKVSVEVWMSLTISPLFRATIRSQTSTVCTKS